MTTIPWEQFTKYNLDEWVELRYCYVCKVKVYRQFYNYRKQVNFKARVRYSCRLCGTIAPMLIKHHITYTPEETIAVCSACHGLIHKCSFPSSLWKQKRPVKPKTKLIYCGFCHRQHRSSSKIYRRHQLCCLVIDLHPQEIHLKHKLARAMGNVELQNKLYKRIKRKISLRKQIYRNLPFNLKSRLKFQLKARMNKENIKKSYKDHYILEYV